MDNKLYTLKRIEECLAACEGISDPVDVLRDTRDYLDALHKVTTNEGIITCDVDKVLAQLRVMRKKLGQQEG